MPRVFISHSTTDREFVEHVLLPLLQGHGIEPWYAPQDIQTATQWERTIVAGLESSDWFVLVMSPRAAASEWVKDEVNWAIGEREGRIVPLLLENCDPLGFHIRLPRIQHIDFRTDHAEGGRRLLAVWDSRLAPKPEPTAPVYQAPAADPRADRVNRGLDTELALRAYDSRVVDEIDERAMLQYAMQNGESIVSAKSALRRICAEKDYILISDVLQQVRELLVRESADRGVTAEHYRAAVEFFQKLANGRMNELTCRRMILLDIIEKTGLRAKAGFFSNWYRKERTYFGLK